MRDTEVTAESLREAKLNIGQSAEDTDAALTSFIAQLDSFGEPWGNDDLGSLIAMSYQGIYGAFMDCFGSNLELIDDYAERVGLAADDYDATDQATADSTSRIAATTVDLPL
jgi:hypothetical protein